MSTRKHVTNVQYLYDICTQQLGIACMPEFELLALKCTFLIKILTPDKGM